jgi:hypothetical protein
MAPLQTDIRLQSAPNERQRHPQGPGDGSWLEARFERRPNEVRLAFGDSNSLLIGRSDSLFCYGLSTAVLDFVIYGVLQFPQLSIVEVLQRTG